MKIYLAARYSRIAELNAYKRELEAWGHIVTSRWLNGEHQRHGADAAKAVERHNLDSYPELGALFAQDDIDDLIEADIVIAFSERVGAANTGRGGRHVEIGIALALKKRISLIGHRENVFHCLPEIEQWDDWVTFKLSIK